MTTTAGRALHKTDHGDPCPFGANCALGPAIRAIEEEARSRPFWDLSALPAPHRIYAVVQQLEKEQDPEPVLAPNVRRTWFVAAFHRVLKEQARRAALTDDPEPLP